MNLNGNSKKKGQQKPLREPMDTPSKDSMVLHLVRVPKIYRLAKDKLKPEMFPKEDIVYAVVWRALLNIVSKSETGDLPDKGFRRKLESEIVSTLNSDPDLDQSVYTELLGDDSNSETGLIDWIFKVEDSDLDEFEGTTLLKKYLHDQTVVRPLKDYVFNLGNQIPEDISELLRGIETQKQKVESIGDIKAAPAITELYEPIDVPKFTTNVSFLDEYMSGGQADGEVYVLLGPSGVGKTTLGVQICCSGARYGQQLYRSSKNEKDLRHWYFFSYEQPIKPDIYHRVWSHMAQIHVDTFRNNEKLSTSSDLKPYEIEKFKNQLAQNLKVPGEQERFNAISKELNPLNLWLFDMSGFDDPTAGRGGVDEMVRVIDDEYRSGKNIGGMVIDYAGLVADRYIAHNSLRYDDLRHILRGFVDKIRTLIASKYSCPVWVLHQLAGAANKKSPMAKQHHADAAECKTFGDNAVFAFSLGTKDDKNMCRITCSKSRRSAGTTLEKIIFIDGAYCTMRGMDGQFVFDSTANRIISINEQQQFVSPKARKKPAPDQSAVLGMDKALWPTARNIELGDDN